MRNRARRQKMKTAFLHFVTNHQPPLISSSSSFYFLNCRKPKSKFKCNNFSFTSNHKVIGVCSALPDTRTGIPQSLANEQEEEEEELEEKEPDTTIGGNYGIIVSSCVIGILTGLAVVVFNNGVHEIRDIFWDGIPYRGASWLREEPLDSIWIRVIFVPACGGLIVSFLNTIRSLIHDNNNNNNNSNHPFLAVLSPFLKSVAACFTLGTGNSLGPEGPSVEIGSSIAKGIGSFTLSPRQSQTKLSLLAAGSAAGISSGFNAAVAGCFFAVESVLWPSSANKTASLTNTTSMVIISAVVASVVSEVGLGSEPAFKVPEYDFRSIGELPLYLLLGVLCGLVSLSLSRCTSFLLSTVNNLHRDVGIPRPVFPVVGGLAVGMIALAYPEILYWGFENVDILLESRPFVKGLSADLLLQLVGVKIVATSLCRASGLVGGYYAPSLFIGAATGMAYGKLISLAFSQSSPVVQLSILEVASPQAYGLVGMAATLAGVCQVPLTAVLLLFELTQDYRIVLPLLGAVGLSSWITSGQSRREVMETRKANKGNVVLTKQPEISSSAAYGQSSGYVFAEKATDASNLCEVESSLCLDDSSIEKEAFKKRIFVSEAMRTQCITVFMSTLLTEAVSLMLLEKQSCALIVDERNVLVGLLTLGDIEDFNKITKAKAERSKELLVSEICSLDGEICQLPWTAKPSMDLFSVQLIMDRYGLSEVPVVSEHAEDHKGQPVGLLDRECITLTCSRRPEVGQHFKLVLNPVVGKR
ncbi:chloride channel protein CLC-e isoform X1 [Ricinus communis]|uniref:chloride channel protein CLC-e isoform X1 n=1 Tax=Ricinus communis TaxID=3988 RepID=UPI00201AC3ED|nr:chloride channel protein CLC-e isoform X1 [Ricinus communis]